MQCYSRKRECMSDELDWDPIRTLARRVLQGGEGLVLTDDIRVLLERTALEVGIDVSEAAERTPAPGRSWRSARDAFARAPAASCLH